MTLNFDISLSKSQQEIYELVHNDKYKFITVVMSRQSGKSVLMLVLCVEWLFQKNNAIAYICRNFVLAKRLYRELIKIIPQSVIKSSNGSELFIETIYGSTLTFYSAEQGSSLRGLTFTHLILDEMAFHKQEQPDGTHLWNDILSPTLKARGKKCIFVSTPLGKNNIFYQMYKRGLSDDFPNYASVKKTVYDDGFITKDEIEEIRKGIPELSFKSEYLCEWLEDGLSFFQGYSECFNIDKYSGGKSWMALDISGDGSDETILTQINELNEVRQFQIEGNLDLKYRKIADIINRENPTAVMGEINGIGLPFFNEVKKLVKNKSKLHDWTTTNSSKEEIISDLAVEIAKGEMHFLKDDRELYDQLSDFIVTVSKTRKLTFAARGSGHDDRILSLAMALKCKNDFRFQGDNPFNFILTQNSSII
ncbi:MAG: terminase family protein [Methanobrevibacter sp.]|nr:terminase family protein [Methanobrevibacter sp.]